MNFLENKCTFSRLSKEVIDSAFPFDCGHDDLNDFFRNDPLNYEKEFLGMSYCFLLNENPKEIVCIFTVSNDSIKVNFLPNARKKKVTKQIPREKHFRNYPAVLVGRLGVNLKYRGKGIGRELMDFIKSWFSTQITKQVVAFFEHCFNNLPISFRQIWFAEQLEFRNNRDMYLLVI